MIAIDVDFVEKLGRWCSPNLKSLSITLYYRDLFSKVHKFKNPVIVNSSGVRSTSMGFLSKLESLTIDGDVSLFLIESLLTSVAQSLKSLTIYIHRQVCIRLPKNSYIKVIFVYQAINKLLFLFSWAMVFLKWAKLL